MVAPPTASTIIVVSIGILLNNSRLSDLRYDVNLLRSDMIRRFEEIDSKFDQRFDDLKQTWWSELRRVEEVLDARLKHLEER